MGLGVGFELVQRAVDGQVRDEVEDVVVLLARLEG